MAEGGYSEGVPFRVERSSGWGNDKWPWAIVDTVDDRCVAVCVERIDADEIVDILNESN